MLPLTLLVPPSQCLHLQSWRSEFAGWDSFAPQHSAHSVSITGLYLREPTLYIPVLAIPFSDSYRMVLWTWMFAQW